MPKPRPERALTAPQHGTPILHGALAYLECRLHSAQEAGDHTIFIAEVEDVVVREGEPLLFFRGKYRKVGENVGSSPRFGVGCHFWWL